MYRKTVISVLLFLGMLNMSGQGILGGESKTIISNEKTIGLYLNSNGVGADYRFSKFINGRNRFLYDINFNYIKHPKEITQIVYTRNYSKRFVFGKENFFWEIQGAIGKQKELFIKRDYSSISVLWFYTGGLSLGFKKPIYYDIFSFDESGYPYVTDHQKFDPSIHIVNYGGKSSFFMGINELKIIPGITADTGVEFEYSEKEPVIHSFGVGLAATVYPVKINIMADEQPQWFFFKLYINYRFGSIVDLSPEARTRSRKERRQEFRDAMESEDILRF